jgi:hypothetical protein
MVRETVGEMVAGEAVVGEMVAGETVAAVGELVVAGVCGYISIDPIANSGTDISLVPSSWYAAPHSSIAYAILRTSA